MDIPKNYFGSQSLKRFKGLRRKEKLQATDKQRRYAPIDILTEWRSTSSGTPYDITNTHELLHQQAVVLFLSNGPDSRPLKGMLQTLDDANNAKSPMIHQFLRALGGDKVMHRWVCMIRC